jgi:ABC-type nitrate/sulfonate/bicarbonate transport system ATPase subunit
VNPADVVVATDATVIRGGERVLDQVTTTLRRGEVLVVVGPNGAGKSTLLRAIAGLVPLDSGTVERRGRVAAALQTPALAHRSVLQNVELALSWWSTPGTRAERRQQARSALESFGVGHLEDRPAWRLSGGEMRRVHLARALALRPDVLLLDEPFAGLDETTRAELVYDAASIIGSPDRATVIVVHDRGEAWALGDRVLLMIEGRAVAEGTPREVFEAPASEAAAVFAGFDGWIRNGDRLRRYRPTDVRIDPHGEVRGEVTRRVVLADHVRVELSVPGGRVTCFAGHPGPGVGETISLHLEPGIEFEAQVDGEPVLADRAG